MDWDIVTQKLEIFWSHLYVQMSKFHVFNNIIFQQKKEKKKSSISRFLDNQIAIYFYVDNLVMEHLTIWKKIHVDLLQLIVLDIMRILQAFTLFSTYSEIWWPPNFPLLFKLCTENWKLYKVQINVYGTLHTEKWKERKKQYFRLTIWRILKMW